MTASLSELTAAAERLERDGAEFYRVLRRMSRHAFHQLRGFALPYDHIGIYVDVESTGDNPAVDEPIQLAMVRFAYTDTGQFVGILDDYVAYHEPSREISEAATAVHGLRIEDVRGGFISPLDVEHLLQNASLCLAHHAGFDRPLLERFFPAFASIAWACGYKDVDWKQRGYACAKLVHLVADRCREFYEAHSALDDCYAGLRALTYNGIDEPAPFEELLQNAARPTVRVWAVGSPFAYKDVLKERGYSWADKDRHPPKGCWYRDVPESEARVESAWLSTHALVHAPTLKRITAKDRYSVRA